MTEKKQKIIEVALELFAQQGYAVTSTSSIAVKAGVSEGLIFRHFTSKEGLLDAIVQLGLQEMQQLAQTIIEEKDPNSVLLHALQLPIQLIRQQPTFWKLQFSLKHQQPEIAKNYTDSDILAQLKDSIENAFRQLKYANPRAETRLLLIIVGGIVNELDNIDQIDQDAFIRFVRDKYHL